MLDEFLNSPYSTLFLCVGAFVLLAVAILLLVQSENRRRNKLVGNQNEPVVNQNKAFKVTMANGDEIIFGPVQPDGTCSVSRLNKGIGFDRCAGIRCYSPDRNTKVINGAVRGWRIIIYPVDESKKPYYARLVSRIEQL